MITPFPNLFSQKLFNKLILSLSFTCSLTISSKPIYLTGLKKCVMQKSFLSLSFNFSERIFRGIVDVLDETIESFFLSLKIWS